MINKKLTLAATAALSILAFVASCSDSMSEVGSSVLPATDKITVREAVFDLNVESVYRDSVYVRTGYPLLGRVIDPSFGELNAGYLAQFYANRETGLDVRNSNDSLTFGVLRTSLVSYLESQEPGKWDPDHFYQSSFDSIVGNQIDSMTIRIYYESYYGDSLSPMQVSVYSLNSDADFESMPESEFYSNNDFSTLYSEDDSHLLGRKAYTSANRELSDSVRHLSGYMNYIEVKLDDKYKEQFMKMCVEAAIARDKKNPRRGEFNDIFADASKLRESWLSGVCVKPSFGDGSLIKVYYTAIYFFFSSYHRYAEDGTLLRNYLDDADSTYTVNHVKYIAVTPDVIQMSGIGFNDSHKSERLASPDSAYISSPQGYYTTIDLPVGKIINTMYTDPVRVDSSYFLNAANFYLRAYKPRGYVLSSKPASTVLMVRNDSINTFFEEGMLPSSSTSCYASYVCDSVPRGNYNDPTQGVYYYRFGNIASVIIGLAENAGWKKSDPKSVEVWEAALKAQGKLTSSQTIDDFVVKMAVIPVDVTTSNQGALLSISNYVLPTAVRLWKGADQQHLRLTYTFEGSE